MKKVDDGKVSLVEFLGSIKFNRRHDEAGNQDDGNGHFARLRQCVRGPHSSEENQLIRSAN
jgi:hypothetical protein